MVTSIHEIASYATKTHEVDTLTYRKYKLSGKPLVLEVTEITNFIGLCVKPATVPLYVIEIPHYHPFD